jgi:hypothetical protein
MLPLVIAVAGWGPNRLDVFGVGSDGGLYHKAWTGAAWQADWENLGGKFTSAPAVATWGPNRLDVFGVGSDGGLYHKAWTGAAWQADWENLGGDFPHKPPPGTCSASSFSPSLVFLKTDFLVVWRCDDNLLYMANPQRQGTALVKVTGTPVMLVLPSGETQTISSLGRPSVAVFGQVLLLAWTGLDGILNVAQSHDGIEFQGQISLPDKSAFGPCIAAGINSDDFKAVALLAWVGTDGKGTLNVRVSADGSAFGPPIALVETSLDTPAISSITEGSNYMAWTGTDEVGTLSFAELRVEPNPAGNYSAALVGKHNYSGDQDGGPDFSRSGPALAYTPIGGATALAYRGTLQDHLYFFASGDNTLPPLPQLNKDHGSIQRYELQAQSICSPSVAFSAVGDLFWTWIGLDKSINFQIDGQVTMPRISGPL